MKNLELKNGFLQKKQFDFSDLAVPASLVLMWVIILFKVALN